VKKRLAKRETGMYYLNMSNAKTNQGQKMDADTTAMNEAMATAAAATRNNLNRLLDALSSRESKPNQSWTGVATLQRQNVELQELVDRAYGEGEYAD
jgi:hypothetical protein